MPAQNSLLKDFRAQIRTRFAEDSDNMSYSDWIIKNTHLKKVPFSFKGFEFQRAIVDDMHQNLTVMKCSQIGLTEVQLRKFAAFLARNVGVSGIFTLPDDMMYRRVSSTRFAPIIAEEPVFNLGYDKPIRRMDLYQINQSFGFFTGNKESDATSINADILFHDEVDLSDQEMLGLFQSRLQGSDYRITQGFSTPTFEGFGIDSLFRASDQHEYLLRCVHCGHHNIPEFTPRFVTIPGLPSSLGDLTEIDVDVAARLDLANAYLRCETCGHRLDRNDPSLREWVPRYPGRRGRGYRVTPFCVSRLGIDYIVDQLLQYKQRDAMRRFYNTVLGMPYNDSNARLSEIEIKAIMAGSSREDAKGSPVMVGIDVGITCHVVIMHLNQDRPNVFEWRQVLAENLVDEITTLMEEYQLVGGCMDRNPYTPLANEIRDLTHGRIVPIEYATAINSQAVTIVKDELDNLSHIRANRTSLLDRLVTAIRKRRIVFSGYGQFENVIIQHLRDMVRIEKDDEVAVWQKLTGNDHFFHALGYAFYALQANDAIYYKGDFDKRIMGHTGLVVTMKNEPEINMQNRRKTTMSLGQL